MRPGWGRITEVRRADGSVEHYEYDNADHVTATTDGNGGVISYAYNSLAELARSM